MGVCVCVCGFALRVVHIRFFSGEKLVHEKPKHVFGEKKIVEDATEMQVNILYTDAFKHYEFRIVYAHVSKRFQPFIFYMFFFLSFFSFVSFHTSLLH